jgi:hypothetical protein
MGPSSSSRSAMAGESERFIVVAILPLPGRMPESDVNFRRAMIHIASARTSKDVTSTDGRLPLSMSPLLLLRFHVNSLLILRSLFATQICLSVRQRSRIRASFVILSFGMGFHSRSLRRSGNFPSQSSFRTSRCRSCGLRLSRGTDRRSSRSSRLFESVSFICRWMPRP